MKFRMHIYLNNPQYPTEFLGHRSKVKVMWFFGAFLCTCCCGYPRTVLSLQQVSKILFS